MGNRTKRLGFSLRMGSSSSSEFRLGPLAGSSCVLTSSLVAGLLLYLASMSCARASTDASMGAFSLFAEPKSSFLTGEVIFKSWMAAAACSDAN